MRCDDVTLFAHWALELRGTGVRLEIVPVIPSDETARIVAAYLGTPAGAV
jgi:hypothetical protein